MPATPGNIARNHFLKVSVLTAHGHQFLEVTQNKILSITFCFGNIKSHTSKHGELPLTVSGLLLHVVVWLYTNGLKESAAS
jgi:hypothetical protein